MKHVVVTMSFILRDDASGLADMNELQLTEEVLDLLEDQEVGMAEYGTAHVRELKIEKL